jgi:hypothetical protein
MMASLGAAAALEVLLLLLGLLEVVADASLRQLAASDVEGPSGRLPPVPQLLLLLLSRALRRGAAGIPYMSTYSCWWAFAHAGAAACAAAITRCTAPSRKGWLRTSAADCGLLAACREVSQRMKS